ncbi:MAG: hypothetical protein QXD66_01350 [Candidatus Nezhaarchaeales archaeon]
MSSFKVYRRRWKSYGRGPRLNAHRFAYRLPLGLQTYLIGDVLL